MNLIDRFKYVMKVYNETPSSFADKIGVQRSSVSHILNGRNKPSLDFIQKIIVHFPKIDAQWLINGKQADEDAIVKAEVEIEQPIEKVKEQQPIKEVAENNENTKHEMLDKVENKEKNPKSIKQLKAEKQIEKIIIFYSDNTFETFKN